MALELTPEQIGLLNNASSTLLFIILIWVLRPVINNVWAGLINTIGKVITNNQDNNRSMIEQIRISNDIQKGVSEALITQNNVTTKMVDALSIQHNTLAEHTQLLRDYIEEGRKHYRPAIEKFDHALTEIKNDVKAGNSGITDLKTVVNEFLEKTQAVVAQRETAELILASIDDTLPPLPPLEPDDA